jgi:hypothetical protein
MFIIDLINNVFEPIKFQAQETLIHILYAKLVELVLKLMSRIFGVDELFHEDTCNNIEVFVLKTGEAIRVCSMI